MPRPTGTACRRCPLDVGDGCGRFRRAARLPTWRYSRRIFVDLTGPCSTANLSAWLAVDGHSLRQEHVGRHLRGRGGVEGHVGGPEAKKWAMGILFYVLTRRLPALTLQIRGKWTCEVQLILETPNEIWAQNPDCPPTGYELSSRKNPHSLGSQFLIVNLLTICD